MRDLLVVSSKLVVTASTSIAKEFLSERGRIRLLVHVFTEGCSKVVLQQDQVGIRQMQPSRPKELRLSGNWDSGPADTYPIGEHSTNDIVGVPMTGVLLRLRLVLLLVALVFAHRGGCVTRSGGHCEQDRLLLTYAHLCSICVIRALTHYTVLYSLYKRIILQWQMVRYCFKPYASLLEP